MGGTRLQVPWLAGLVLTTLTCQPAVEVPLPADWSRIPPPVRTGIERAAEACRASPDDPAAFERLGRVYHGNVHKELASRAYETALSLGSTDARTSYLLGLIYEEKGRIEEAIDRYRVAVEAEPAYAPAHYHLGRVLRDAGRVEESIEAMRRATQLEPGEASFLVGLGASQRQAERLAETEMTLRQALRLDPDNAEAHQLLGLTLRASGRPGDARPHLNRKSFRTVDVVADPWLLEVQALASSPQIVLDRAEKLLANGRVREARELLLGATRDNPELAEAWRLLAQARDSDGDAQAAVDAFQTALRIEPEHADTRAELARVLLRHGHHSGADREARHALKLEPAHANARIVLAGLALARNRPADALETIRGLLDEAQQVMVVHMLHGEALMQTNDLAGAAEAFQRAAELEPGQPFPRRRLALVYQQLGRNEDARRELQQAETLEKAAGVNRRG